MADSENKDLMKFLERQFEGIYQRLANTPTKDDLANFATKDDLAGFATKDDLANFATKDDLAGFATKDDLASFATKDDLRAEISATKDELRAEISATKDELDAKITAAKEKAMRHTGVLIEDVHHKLDIIIEGLMGANEGRDRDKKENEQEHARLEKMTLLNTADVSALDQRVGRLEGRV